VAESSWPSPSNGRVVDDVQYEKLGLSYGAYGGVVGDFSSPQLVYGDSSGMQIKVAADRYAQVRGHEWWSGSSIFTKAIAANASGSTRVDLVVLRLSRTTWDVVLTVVTGTPGAGAPAATQNTGTTGSWDLPLATVSVASGAATISAANVTYVAPHLDSSGQYRSPSAAALAYIPHPTAGLEASITDGTQYRYDTVAWVPKAWYGTLGVRNSFVPTLTAPGVNPILGTGSSRLGHFTYLPGPYVQYSYFLQFGTSAFGAGSGQYFIDLPVPCSMPWSSVTPAHGTGLCRDNSASDLRDCTPYINGANSLSFFVSTIGTATNVVPWTWAASDYMSGTIVYPVA
jgi:hypothetical protein